jgi:hypothetical protein
LSWRRCADCLVEGKYTTDHDVIGRFERPPIDGKPTERRSEGARSLQHLAVSGNWVRRYLLSETSCSDDRAEKDDGLCVDGAADLESLQVSPVVAGYSNVAATVLGMSRY